MSPVSRHKKEDWKKELCGLKQKKKKNILNNITGRIVELWQKAFKKYFRRWRFFWAKGSFFFCTLREDFLFQPASKLCILRGMSREKSDVKELYVTVKNKFERNLN